MTSKGSQGLPPSVSRRAQHENPKLHSRLPGLKWSYYHILSLHMSHLQVSNRSWQPSVGDCSAWSQAGVQTGISVTYGTFRFSGWHHVTPHSRLWMSQRMYNSVASQSPPGWYRHCSLSYQRLETLSRLDTAPFSRSRLMTFGKTEGNIALSLNRRRNCKPQAWTTIPPLWL